MLFHKWFISLAKDEVFYRSVICVFKISPVVSVSLCRWKTSFFMTEDTMFCVILAAPPWSFRIPRVKEWLWWRTKLKSNSFQSASFCEIEIILEPVAPFTVLINFRTVQKFGVSKVLEMNTYMEQIFIILIKRDSKDICNVCVRETRFNFQIVSWIQQ